MTEEEKVDTVEAAMGEAPPEVLKGVTVSWDDFLKACAERGIEFVEGKTVLQMKEDFLGNLDKVEADSQEEADLSQLVVDIQIALVDGAEIVGSPEDASPKKSKKTKKEKVKKEKVKKEKVAKEPKPKKEKPPKVFKPKLGGVGMKPMCRNLFGEQTKEQIEVAEKEIKDKLAQVYVDAGKGDMAYGQNRATRIFYDIYVEDFGEPPVAKEKPKTVPKVKEKKEKVKKEKKVKEKKEPQTDPEPEIQDPGEES